MILHLNSNYRNRSLYPNPSSFCLPINGTPPYSFSQNSPPKNKHQSLSKETVDARCTLMTDQNVLFSFIYYQTIPVRFRSLSDHTCIITSLDILPYDPLLSFFFQNTLTGILLQEDATRYSSIITSSIYREDGLYCQTSTPLFRHFDARERPGTLLNPSDHYHYNHDIPAPPVTTSSLDPTTTLTPSSHDKDRNISWTNLLINGFSKYNFAPGLRRLQDDGISNNCIVLNLTKQTLYRVNSILPLYRNVILSPITTSLSSSPDPPSFDDKDYVVVCSPSRTERSVIPVSIVDHHFHCGYQFRWISSSRDVLLPLQKGSCWIHRPSGFLFRLPETILGWREGDDLSFVDMGVLHPGEFSFKNDLSGMQLIMEEEEKENMGEEREEEEKEYGGRRAERGNTGTAATGDGVVGIPPRSFVLEIIRSGYCMKIESLLYPLSQPYLFTWFTVKAAIPIYSYVVDYDPVLHWIITEPPVHPLWMINPKKEDLIRLLYSKGVLLSCKSHFPNISYPISRTTLQCYEVSLLSLTLPNRPLCGSGLLLADVPYVCVLLSTLSTSGEPTVQKSHPSPSFLNSGGGGGGKGRGLMNYTASVYTNNPNAVFATFLCPIANILNPDTNQYIVIQSDQVVTMKINFQEHLQFQLFLPNGELVIFSPVFSVDSADPDSISTSPLCLHFSAYNPGQPVMVYNEQEEMYISATFSLKAK